MYWCKGSTPLYEGEDRFESEASPKKKFLKSMSFEKAVSNLQGSERDSLLVMDRDLNPTTAPIGESPMVQFLISGCSAVGSALDLGSRGRRFKSCHSDHDTN